MDVGCGLESPTIQDVLVEDIGAGVDLAGTILRCHLTYRDNASPASESVIVKLPSPNRKTFRRCKKRQLYKREYNFFRNLQSIVHFRTPNLLYGDFEDRSRRFILILENLRELESVDQLGGAGEEHAKRAIRAIAKMHGQFWNKVDQPPLPEDFRHPVVKDKILLQITYLLCLPSALDKFGHRFSEKMCKLAETFGSRVANVVSDIATGPITLIHGDFRPDNLFFDSAEKNRVAIIDWQLSGLFCGLFDVA